MPIKKIHIECDILKMDNKWEELPEISDIIELTVNYAHNNPQYIHKDIHSLEISIVLTNNTHITELNRDYRGKDKPTNVLSFPQDEPGLLGDIIIARETIIAEAKDQGKTMQNHFTHMLIHGCLHLMGFDHIEEKEAQTMEDLEIKILSQMNIKNPYESNDFKV